MSISLSDGSTTVQLPDDLYWADELAWSPVQQSVGRSITGALIVQTGLRQAGRPITLQPFEGERSSWISRAVLLQLQAWVALPAPTLTLVLRGQARSVLWRHQDGEPIQAQPVLHLSDVQSDDVYVATLRFMEI